MWCVAPSKHKMLRKPGLMRNAEFCATNHIDEGYRQAERGESIDALQARKKIEQMKEKLARTTCT